MPDFFFFIFFSYPLTEEARLFSSLYYRVNVTPLRCAVLRKLGRRNNGGRIFRGTDTEDKRDGNTERKGKGESNWERSDDGGGGIGREEEKNDRIGDGTNAFTECNVK